MIAIRDDQILLRHLAIASGDQDVTRFWVLSSIAMFTRVFDALAMVIASFVASGMTLSRD